MSAICTITAAQESTITTVVSATLSQELVLRSVMADIETDIYAPAVCAGQYRHIQEQISHLRCHSKFIL